MDSKNASNDSTTSIENKSMDQTSMTACSSKNTVEENETNGRNESGLVVQKKDIQILEVQVVTPQTDDINYTAVTKTVENADQKHSDYEVNIVNTCCIDAPAEGQEVFSSVNQCETMMDASEAVVSITGGLSLLSQYLSDDDTNSVIEVPIAGHDYRNQVVEIHSDGSTDSDSGAGSSDVECLNDLRKTIEKRIAVVDVDEEDDDDDNDESTSKKRYHSKLRVKGELLLEELPPIQDLQINVPEDECIEFGKIHSIVDQLVLVGSLPNSILLNLDTVIFLEKGKRVLGEVFDVLGQVADPLYCVRFNSNKQIKEKQINIGDIVYVAPKTQYTQYVILSNLMNIRGSDASWENDVEPPPRFLDYSDDEQEQLARRLMRNKDRPMDNNDATKRVRSENENELTTSRPHNSNRLSDQRNNKGGAISHTNAFQRPRADCPQNQQRTSNHNRNSWHSNYYPQHFTHHSPGNYGMHLPRNQPPHLQTYTPNMTAYSMPPPHMSYRPPESMQYGAPRMFNQHASPSFSNRPPTFHNSRQSSHHQYICTPPPPPPGSQ